MLQGLALGLVDGHAKGQSDWGLDSTKGSMQLIRIRRSKWDAWDGVTHTVMLVGVVYQHLHAVQAHLGPGTSSGCCLNRFHRHSFIDTHNACNLTGLLHVLAPSLLTPTRHTSTMLTPKDAAIECFGRRVPLHRPLVCPKFLSSMTTQSEKSMQKLLKSRPFLRI